MKTTMLALCFVAEQLELVDGDDFQTGNGTELLFANVDTAKMFEEEMLKRDYPVERLGTIVFAKEEE